MKSLAQWSLIFALLSTFVGCGVFTDIPYQRAKKRGPYDAVIVPGFPYDQRPDLNIIYKVRIFWAYHLYQKGIAKNLIFSGSAVHTPYVEGRIMAEFAKQMGIPEEHIFVEDSAEHSTENLFYGFALAKRMGFQKVAVATDPFQSGMIAFLTNKDKLPVHFIPAKIETVASKYWKTFKFNIDDTKSVKENFVPLVERMDKSERMRGTQGDKFRDKQKASEE